ncbi:ComEC/Rec2 family competence protein, partial [Psychrobacter sp.]|uniref:ComEC/Rec2 family competence protein n=1 Tax=Psychrobacter sp. TaxID=56811 RepID=UPI0025DA27F2
MTPYKNLKQFGLFKLFTKIITLLIFLLAVLCNSVAQRLAMIEASPQKPTYIQALVTPIGLSDKRLEIEDGVVVQGYRQLVKLTDIRYDSLQPNIDNSKENGGNDGNVSDKQPFNPFTTNDNPKSKSKQKTALNNITQSLNYASINTSQLPATMTVMLQSYQIKDLILNDLAPHQHLNMKLSLLPLELKNNDNPDEFDEYRWLSSRHATAKAFVVSMDDKNESVRAKPAHSKIIPTDSKTIPAYTKTNLTLQQQIDVMRYQFREHFIGLMRARSNKDIVTHQVDTPIVKEYKDNDLKIYDSRSSYIKNSEGIVNSNQTKLNQDEVAVTLSLLTGDRNLISDDMTALYRFGGISHLLAISGTHVLFLSLLCASMATAFINYFWPSLYYILPRWQCAFIIAAITAFGYALFAGFDVPALRTACMLLLAGVMRYILAVPAIFKMLLVLGVGMAWADVFVLWQAGFWLSFVAVAVLVAFSQRWDRRDSQNHNLTFPAKLKQQFVALFKLQLWMSVAL